MPIKYINPITTPYSRIGDVAYFDRKAMEEQNKYDKALGLIAKQKEQDANTISYNDEARKQYLKEIQANYDKVVQDNYGNLAKGYNDVLNAITKDASHPYHNLNKIQATNIAEYKQAQQRYGADLITTKSPYKTPLYDAKTNQWADPSSLQYKAQKASDYAKNVEEYIGNDLRGSLQQLGIQPNSKIKYLLDYGSVEKLTKDQIRQLAQSPEAIQLFKSLNPTYNIDNRDAAGYNPKTGQNMFSTDEGISNYIYGVLQDKAYSKANVQHMWNKTAMAEDAAKAKAKADEAKTREDFNNKINFGSDQIIFKNKPTPYLEDPANSIVANNSYNPHNYIAGLAPITPMNKTSKTIKEEKNIKEYSNKLQKTKEFLGSSIMPEEERKQLTNQFTNELAPGMSGAFTNNLGVQAKVNEKINKIADQRAQDTYNKFYQQRLSYQNMKADHNNDHWSMLNAEHMLEPNYLVNNESYKNGVRITKDQDVYDAFGDKKDYKAYKDNNKHIKTFTAYSPKFKKYAVMTIANGNRFETIYPKSIQEKLNASGEINDKLINTDYYKLGKPVVALNKQYGWTNGASLILNPSTGKSAMVYAPKITKKDFPDASEDQLKYYAQQQQQFLTQLNNTTNMDEAWNLLGNELNKKQHNEMPYVTVADPSYIIQTNVKEVMRKYKTAINQKLK